MKHPETYLVTKDNGERPVSPGKCAYCRSAIGEEHEPECVIRKETVVLNVAININVIMDVPEHWDAEQIEFHYNEGCWCSTNIFNTIGDVCICTGTKVAFVRDATEEDEQDWVKRGGVVIPKE